MSEAHKLRAVQNAFCYHPDLATERDWLEMADKFLVTLWQPIETVPKDGTSVLLFRQGLISPYCEVSRWRVDRRGVGDWEGGGPEADAYAKATHWMPLPTPPA